VFLRAYQTGAGLEHAVEAVYELAIKSAKASKLYANPPEITRAAKKYGVSVAALLSGDRRRRYVMARRAAIVMMRENGMSYPDIAMALRLRNHTSVMEAHRKATKENPPTVEV
jgi:chromosomal replication initiation ATPase DnaA